MFYTPRIKDDTFPILEIGPGALPFHLSDVWLDIDFSEEDKIIQSGGEKPATGRPMVYYDGKRFPFKDKAFKYVIASHVLEHVSWQDVPLFISEMERVSEAGYIELPRWTWELVNDIPTHRLTGDVKDEKLILYKKTCNHDYNFFTKIMIDESVKFREYIEREKQLFFCGIEWRKKILYELRDNSYQIATRKEDIANILKKDIFNMNVIPLRTINKKEPEQLPANFLSNILRRCAIKKENLMRGSIDKAKMVQDILQCPKCSKKIDIALHCSECGFNFNKKGVIYFPHY